MTDFDVDVIVVGAGPAGIAVGRTLYESNQPIRFALFEGRGRVGGRAHTDYSLGQPVDLGASWIHHSAPSNPIVPLASKHIKRKLGTSVNQPAPPVNSQDSINATPEFCTMENAASVLCGLVDAVVDGQAIRVTDTEGLGGGSGRFLLFDHDGKRVSTPVYQSAVNAFNHLMEYADERAAEMRSTVPIPHTQSRDTNIDERSQLIAKHYEEYSQHVDQVDCSVQNLIADKRASLISEYQLEHQNEPQTGQFERVLDFLISGCEQFEGESIDLMSGMYWQAGEDASIECDQFVQRGYGELVKDLSEEYEMDIRLRHVVRCIDSSDKDVVRVHVDIEDANEHVQQSVVFTCRHAVITATLGCLKHGQIAFGPPLPSWKQLAIDRAGFGLMNKIVLQFDKPFWGDDTISIGRTDDHSRGRYRWFLSLRPTLLLSEKTLQSHPNHTYPMSTSPASPNILICFSTAQTGIEIENSLSDEEMVAECMQVLRECFGHPDNQPNQHSTSQPSDSAITADDTSIGTSTELLSSAPLSHQLTFYDIPNPSNYIVTRWWQDRFARGAYSHFALGANDLTCAMLAAPVADGRVRFAGEHTNQTSIGCVDSAYESGLREAKCIIDAFQSNK